MNTTLNPKTNIEFLRMDPWSSLVCQPPGGGLSVYAQFQKLPGFSLFNSGVEGGQYTIDLTLGAFNLSRPPSSKLDDFANGLRSYSSRSNEPAPVLSLLACIDETSDAAHSAHVYVTSVPSPPASLPISLSVVGINGLPNNFHVTPDECRWIKRALAALFGAAKSMNVYLTNKETPYENLGTRVVASHPVVLKQYSLNRHDHALIDVEWSRWGDSDFFSNAITISGLNAYSMQTTALAFGPQHRKKFIEKNVLSGILLEGRLSYRKPRDSAITSTSLNVTADLLSVEAEEVPLQRPTPQTAIADVLFQGTTLALRLESTSQTPSLEGVDEVFLSIFAKTDPNDKVTPDGMFPNSTASLYLVPQKTELGILHFDPLPVVDRNGSFLNVDVGSSNSQFMHRMRALRSFERLLSPLPNVGDSAVTLPAVADSLSNKKREKARVDAVRMLRAAFDTIGRVLDIDPTRAKETMLAKIGGDFAKRSQQLLITRKASASFSVNHMLKSGLGVEFSQTTVLDPFGTPFEETTVLSNVSQSSTLPLYTSEEKRMMWAAEKPVYFSLTKRKTASPPKKRRKKRTKSEAIRNLSFLYPTQPKQPPPEDSDSDSDSDSDLNDASLFFTKAFSARAPPSNTPRQSSDRSSDSGSATQLVQSSTIINIGEDGEFVQAGESLPWFLLGSDWVYHPLSEIFVYEKTNDTSFFLGREDVKMHGPVRARLLLEYVLSSGEQETDAMKFLASRFPQISSGVMNIRVIARTLRSRQARKGEVRTSFQPRIPLLPPLPSASSSSFKLYDVYNNPYNVAVDGVVPTDGPTTVSLMDSPVAFVELENFASRIYGLGLKGISLPTSGFDLYTIENKGGGHGTLLREEIVEIFELFNPSSVLSEEAIRNLPESIKIESYLGHNNLRFVRIDYSNQSFLEVCLYMVLLLSMDMVDYDHTTWFARLATVNEFSLQLRSVARVERALEDTVEIRSPTFFFPMVSVLIQSLISQLNAEAKTKPSLLKSRSSTATISQFLYQVTQSTSPSLSPLLIHPSLLSKLRQATKLVSSRLSINSMAWNVSDSHTLRGIERADCFPKFLRRGSCPSGRVARMFDDIWEAVKSENATMLAGIAKTNLSPGSSSLADYSLETFKAAAGVVFFVAYYNAMQNWWLKHDNTQSKSRNSPSRWFATLPSWFDETASFEERVESIRDGFKDEAKEYFENIPFIDGEIDLASQETNRTLDIALSIQGVVPAEFSRGELDEIPRKRDLQKFLDATITKSVRFHNSITYLLLLTKSKQYASNNDK